MMAGRVIHEAAHINREAMTISAGPRMKAALVLAIAADLVQLIGFPLFFEGVASPAEDVLDLCMAGVLGFLLGWHWEFLPSFAGKLVPGVDLVPLWTLAVANVYRKSRPLEASNPRNVGRATTDRRDS